MKFHIHLIIQIILLTLLTITINFNSGLIITLAHFIPSLDYLMKKTKFHPKLHRKLFHNIFVMILAFFLFWHFTNLQISVLGTTNFLLHIIMDARGKGVVVFFPFSNFRLKIWK